MTTICPMWTSTNNIHWRKPYIEELWWAESSDPLKKTFYWCSPFARNQIEDISVCSICFHAEKVVVVVQTIFYKYPKLYVSDTSLQCVSKFRNLFMMLFNPMSIFYLKCSDSYKSKYKTRMQYVYTRKR